MLFSELYSTYYNAVAKILRAAADHPVDDGELRRIVQENAFSESILTIEPALKEQRWQLLYKDGTTPVMHPPELPLTTLEKRWLKAVFLDPRMRLFCDDIPAELADVKPLFTPEDHCVFDKYSDGDPFEDEDYIQNFRTIRTALRSGHPLDITIPNRKGTQSRIRLIPRLLEYSEKDDKFRLTGDSASRSYVINLGRIIECRLSEHGLTVSRTQKKSSAEVEFDLFDTRNALERVLMHFAHFEKQVIKTGDRSYHVCIRYEREDETELLIRILSFGPMIKVTAPQSFILLIKMRLERQKNYISAKKAEETQA